MVTGFAAAVNAVTIATTTERSESNSFAAVDEPLSFVRLIENWN